MGEGKSAIGRLVAGVGGAALAISIFLPWYSLSLADVLRGLASQLPPQLSGALSDPLAAADGLTLTWSGWDAVHWIRLVLLLVGVGAFVSSLAPSRTEGNGQALLLLVVGLLAAGLAAYRIQSPPSALSISLGPLQFTPPAPASGVLNRFLHVHIGAWVALFGGALVLVGGWSQLERRQPVSAPPSATYPIAPASKAPPGWT